VLDRGLSRKNILLENKDQEFAWCVCNKPLRNEIPAPATAAFHVRRTEGTMPTGKSFSAFQKLWTPAPKRVSAIFGADSFFGDPA
jgi:hypothetical protein